MTTLIEHEVYGIPYRLLDFVEQYLNLKFIKYERYPNYHPLGMPEGGAYDAHAADDITIYNVNNSTWSRVLQFELDYIAAVHKYRMLATLKGKNCYDIRFKPLEPTCGNPLHFIKYTGKYPRLCKGVLHFSDGVTTYKYSNILLSNGYPATKFNTGQAHPRGKSYTAPYSLQLHNLNALKFPTHLWDALKAIVAQNTTPGCCGGCNASNSG